MKNVTITEVVSFLSGDIRYVYGTVDESVFVNNVADATHVNEYSLDWINKRLTEKQCKAEKSPARVIICDPSIEYTPFLKEQGKILLVVDNPRLSIAKILGRFFIQKPLPGVDETAVIDREAQIDVSAHIGAGCVIGKATIGENTILMPNVVLYDNVHIGNNCLIQAGTIIGTDGLGCQRDSDGKLIKFPHLGGVVISDNVEIGANCQIAKGVLSDTIIGEGCKINGLCFIAHNCILGENVWITGDTMLCGTVRVGKNTTIFSNVIVRDQVSIGEEVMIGMGAVVTKDVPSGETWFGAPAHKK